MGKILRVNLDGSVPEDNPQPLATGMLKYIYASGARSPFSMDYSAGRIFALPPGAGGSRKEVISGLKFPVAAKFGPDGRLWVVCRGREQGEGPTTLHAFRWSKAVSIEQFPTRHSRVQVKVNRNGYPLELLGRKRLIPSR